MTEIKKLGETTEERIEMVTERARGYFKQGLNCAESVLKAFMEVYETGLPNEVVTLATGFGAGMGHTRDGVCGAVSGALMALGTIKGRRDPLAGDDMAERIAVLQKEIYPAFGDMVREIQSEHDNLLLCKELTQPLGDFEGKPRRQFCLELIGACAGIAVKHADKDM